MTHASEQTKKMQEGFLESDFQLVTNLLNFTLDLAVTSELGNTFP